MNGPLSPSALVLAAIVERASAAHVARKLECDESAVRSWARGRRTPSKAWRKKLAAFDATIVEDRWNVGADDADAATGQTPDAGVAPARAEAAPFRLDELPLLAVDAAGEARLLDVIEKCDQLYAEARNPDAHASVRDRTAILAAKTAAVTRLSRIRGEDSVTATKIADSPTWKRFKAVILEVLTRHRDEPTHKAIEELIKRLELEGG